MPKRVKPAPAEPGVTQPITREPTKRPESAFETVQVCWVMCDKCEKWRRIPGKEEDLPDYWVCTDHPAGNITCATPEEEMDEDEKY